MESAARNVAEEKPVRDVPGDRAHGALQTYHGQAGQVFHFPAGFVMRQVNKSLRCKLVIEVQAQAIMDTGGSTMMQFG